MFFWSIDVLEASASQVIWTRLNAGRGGRLRLVARAAEGLGEQGAGGVSWLDAVREATRQLRRRMSGERPVVLVVPAHLVLTRRVEAPAVDAEQRRQIVGFEAQRSLPFALNEVEWGCTPADQSGVMLCAAKREAVESLCVAVEEGGGRCHAAIPSPAALLAVARSTPQLEPGSLLLHADGPSVSLCLVGMGRIDFRSFALDGSEPATPGAMEETLPTASPASEIGREVKRSVLKFQQRSGGTTVRRVRLVGAAASIRGLSDELRGLPGGPVVDVVGGGSDEPAEGISPPWGVALLVRSGLAGEVDLLPARRRTGRDRRRRHPWLALTAALVALSALPPLLRQRARLVSLKASNALAERELASLRVEAHRMKLEAARAERDQLRVAAWRELERRRRSWRSFCADLEARMNTVEDTWFESIRLEPAGEPARTLGTGGGGLRLRVSGWTLDRARPDVKAGEGAYRRAGALLGSLGGSPFVVAVEHEQFDGHRDGLLGFSAVLVTNPDRL